VNELVSMWSVQHRKCVPRVTFFAFDGICFDMVPERAFTKAFNYFHHEAFNMKLVTHLSYLKAYFEENCV